MQSAQNKFFLSGACMIYLLFSVPNLLTVETSAPRLMREATRLAWPPLAACMSGVQPHSSAASRSDGCAASSCCTSGQSPAAAAARISSTPDILYNWWISDCLGGVTFCWARAVRWECVMVFLSGEIFLCSQREFQPWYFWNGKWGVGHHRISISL